MVWIVAGVVLVVVVIVVVVLAYLLLRPTERSSDGPVSIVLFRKTPRRLTEVEVRGAVRRVLGIEAKIERIEIDQQTSAFMVVSEKVPPLCVVDSARTYLEPEDIESEARRAEDPDLRRAIAEHKAWVSVDAYGTDGKLSKELRGRMYSDVLGKVAAEFLDENCLVVFAPAEDLFGRITEKTAELLSGGGVAELLNDADLNMPVVHVEEEDGGVNRAVEEARRRLPELIAEFKQRGEESCATVKARFVDDQGAVEHMWAIVKTIESDGLSVEIANRPISAKLPQRGEVVKVAHDEVSDWMYFDERMKPVGMFVEKILNKNGA